MSVGCGIVGLPNVGKSTLFNALTRTSSAQAANYPFCTIEPNNGEIGVPDSRLEVLSGIVNPSVTIPVRVSFSDIAGLVRGASRGEGLGNKFLGHIRETDAVIHVLRCFEDEGITHSEGRIDPLADAEIVETELMLADLESLERRRASWVKKERGGDSDSKKMLSLIDSASAVLCEGRRAVEACPSDAADRVLWSSLNLLTAIPMLYACNVSEGDAADGNEWTRRVADRAASMSCEHVVISAEMESQVASLDDDERREYLEAFGCPEGGLERLAKSAWSLLGLRTFFTAGEKEARAWAIEEGSSASRAAGKIHTDFERGFICAEIVGYDDFVSHGGESGAREAGKLRAEGRDYVMRDGDVARFRFNV